MNGMILELEKDIAQAKMLLRQREDASVESGNELKDVYCSLRARHSLLSSERRSLQLELEEPLQSIE